MNATISIENEHLVSCAICPFGTMRQATSQIPIKELLEQLKLENTRKFIVYNLDDAIKNQDDEFIKFKLSVLKTQMYQPNSIDELIVKFLNFKTHLFAVPEYEKSLKHIKSMK